MFTFQEKYHLLFNHYRQYSLFGGEEKLENDLHDSLKLLRYVLSLVQTLFNSQLLIFRNNVEENIRKILKLF